MPQPLWSRAHQGLKHLCVTDQRIHFAFLYIGHFLDHLFMLVFASVAAMALTREWGMRTEPSDEKNASGIAVQNTTHLF